MKQTKEFKPRITTLEYVENQIVDLLDKEVIYKAQLKVIEKTLLDEERKENALKAIGALQAQLEAVEESTKAWREYYEELIKK